MAIFKRGKFYWFDFVFDGKRVQKSTKQQNRKAAIDIEAAYRTKLAKMEIGLPDLDAEPERKTIGQLLDALSEDFKVRGKDDSKNLNLIATVKQELADRWADQLTTADVNDYIKALRAPQKKKKKGRRSKSLANSTIKHRLQILASAFELENAAREDAGLEPLRVPRFPKLSEQGNERSGFLSRAQFDVLYSHLPADLKDFSLFGFLVGWRRNAIATLEWSDIRDGNIYLRGVNSKNGKPYYVPIVGELVQLIDRRKEARSIKTDSGVLLSSLVFHRDGSPISEFRKSWVTACKNAGCEGLIFHDLRRSAARNLIRSGVTKDVAKQVGGWKTDSMFMRYNVTGEEDLREAMEKITKYHQAEQQRVVQISK